MMLRYIVLCCLLSGMALCGRASIVMSDAVARLLNDIKLLPCTELHHLVVIKDGQVAADIHLAPYRASDAHNQFSASKMLTAMAVGLAVDDGKLSLDDRLVDVFADKCPANPAPELRSIDVRHLLTMTSGKQVTTSIRDTTTDWVASWLALPGVAPGKVFAYDTMTSFMLSAAVQRVTGRTMLDLLNQRVLMPMGLDEVEWERSPDGINTGGWGLRCSTRSMAMLGQLLLQRGHWRGRQLLSSSWVDQMLADQLSPLGIVATHTDEYHDGYGFQMWHNALPGSYRTQGNFGQLMFCYPAGNLVIAINAATPFQSELLRVVQRDAPMLATSAPSAAAHVQPQEEDAPSTPRLDVQLDLAPNSHHIQSLELRHDDDCAWLTICHDDGSSDRIALGYDKWVYGKLAGTPPYNVWARNRFSGMDRGFTVAGRYSCRFGRQVVVGLHFVDWYSALTLTIDAAARQFSITDNKDPRYPEVIEILNQPEAQHASSWPRWAWMTLFGALFVTLLAAIAHNKYPAHYWQKNKG